MSLYPNVPDLPGVPQLPRSPKFPTPVVATLAIFEGAIWQALTYSPAWGIYPIYSNPNSNFQQNFINSLLSSIPKLPQFGNLTGSTQAIIADSCISVGTKKENNVSEFPIQNGGFASYNKVILPMMQKVRLAKTGSSQDINIFITQIEKYANDLTLVNVVTDGYTFQNYTISSWDCSRTSQNGVHLVEVEIGLKQVIQITPFFSKTNNSNSINAKSFVNNGLQQPISITEQQSSKVTSQYQY